MILEATETAVPDLAAYRKALEQSKSEDSVLFLVKRGQGTLYVVVPLPKK